jgi:hypothetical protein
MADNQTIQRIIHILGVICGFAAAVIMIIYGFFMLVSKGAPAIAPGKLISIGLAALAATIIATIDGARAFPQLGLWKVGAKFTGLGDLAAGLIFLILAGGIGASFAFH